MHTLRCCTTIVPSRNLYYTLPLQLGAQLNIDSAKSLNVMSPDQQVVPGTPCKNFEVLSEPHTMPPPKPTQSALCCRDKWQQRVYHLPVLWYFQYLRATRTLVRVRLLDYIVSIV